jgi:hypothetical protein
LTSDHGHDITQLIALTEAISPVPAAAAVHASSQRLFADRGYDHDKYRRLLRARGITSRIAPLGLASGHQWVIEHAFAWLHA